MIVINSDIFAKTQDWGEKFIKNLRMSKIFGDIHF